MADVGRNALELQRLEACPAQEGGVGGSKFADTLDDVFTIAAAQHVLLRGRDLTRCVLADLLVRTPVCLLAVRRLQGSQSGEQ